MKIDCHLTTFEQVFQRKYFPGIKFSDDRERQVFFSYIKGFALLILDPGVKNILEIGGGQSTTLLATLGDRLGWELITVDMNPDAIALKIRSQSVSDATLKNIRFRKGVSILANEIISFYHSGISTIGGVPFSDVVKAARTFIDTTMDARKAPRVAKALGLSDFSVDSVIDKILDSNRIRQELLDVFKTTGNEFEFHNNDSEPLQGCLQDIMESENIDAVFLDSGEFSSLPEWEIVETHLRPGGYVILHDIFFPKSFKNWLVCGAIMANPAYETLYIDRSTPQGLMVSQKRI
jgi:hypothetical protein